MGEWEHFKIKYGKNLLTGQEHDARKNIFANNLKFIEKHNAEHALGLHTYTVGINQFADLTNEEFVQQFTGFKAMDDLPESSVEIDVERPAEIDWRQKGAVTPVKNQAQCGSCWAFSTTGTIEGAYFKKTGKLVSLSEQNLMDCSRPNHGCNGGNPYMALLFTIQQGGIDTEESYPYRLDHGVLAVGYGTENGQDYYNVKNSWGKQWGLDGYIKMARNRQNNCGIATMACYAIA